MASPSPVLELRDVRKRFGGLQATDGVSLALTPNERRAIIGPNGAGKTTLFNLISGYLRPDSGSLHFRGEDVSRRSPDALCRLGMSRTFQITSIFPRLTVLENVQVALFTRRGVSLRLFGPARDLYRDAALELLASVELDGLAGELSGTLSHGDQKRLELAVALANEPVVLLLDEPTAGMPTRHRHDLMALVSDLVRERGITLLFTEHDMDVVFSTAERISVMHQGRVIAEGTGDEVRRDEGVQKVYLGWEPTTAS